MKFSFISISIKCQMSKTIIVLKLNSLQSVERSLIPKAKILQKPMSLSNCYNGYMVNNNTM